MIMCDLTTCTIACHFWMERGPNCECGLDTIIGKFVEWCLYDVHSIIALTTSPHHHGVHVGWYGACYIYTALASRVPVVSSQLLSLDSGCKERACMESRLPSVVQWRTTLSISQTPHSIAQNPLYRTAPEANEEKLFYVCYWVRDTI